MASRQGGARPRERAADAVPAGVPVEHQDVLPVVLRADLVDVEERHRRARHRLAHHAVALVVLLPGPGRRGQVDHEVGAGPVPGPQGVERLVTVAVVLVPDVLAELHPEPEGAASGRDLVGDGPVGNAGAGLAGNLAQRVEVPVVVEEPVVRMQGLRMHAVGEGGGEARALDEAPVVADPCRVELSYPTVLADRGAVERDVAEHDGDPVARLADRVAPALEVLDQRVDLPRIAQDVAGDAHLRERHDRRPRRTRPLDEAEHRLDVEVRPAGAHLHLRERDRREAVRHGGGPAHRLRGATSCGVMRDTLPIARRGASSPVPAWREERRGDAEYISRAGCRTRPPARSHRRPTR